MDSFDVRKRSVLQKKDQSIKQSIDTAMIPVCQTINSLNSYYTTSSCAGRIQLYCVDETHSKKSHTFFSVSHEKITDIAQKKALYEKLCASTQPVWLLSESFIIHICARTLDDARRLQELGITLGLKRTALISFEHLTIEFTHTASFCALLADSHTRCSFEFFCTTIDRANMCLEKTHEKLAQLNAKIDSTFT
jgi:tRNA wybutosine-synthesizing protein 3